jgi:hypothetical protein
LPLAYAGDKKVKRFHFSEIIGRLPYVRATVTQYFNHCIPNLNMHYFSTKNLTYFGDQMRTFMNVHLRLDNTIPTKLLGPSGTWVKKHRALRNKGEQETGTVIPHTDYLEAVDQWITVLDDHEALKASNKDEIETLRQAHKAKPQILQAEMATRMRDRVRLVEKEKAAGAEEDIIYED